MLAKTAVILSLSGLGPVEIGMTERQAEKVSGYEIELGELNEGCFEGRMGPAYVLVRGGRIRVISVAKRNRVQTDEGIRVGDTRAKLKRAYGSRLKARPAPLAVGWTIFELRDGRRELQFISRNSTGRIAAIQAGRRPEVDYSEGCA